MRKTLITLALTLNLTFISAQVVNKAFHFDNNSQAEFNQVEELSNISSFTFQVYFNMDQWIDNSSLFSQMGKTLVCLR